MITIVGAGLAGLLAARMLSHHQCMVLEKQKELPNNHSAVLRFRSSTFGDVINIPFRKVQMIKATLPWRNPVADALAYSYKNTKVYRSDRSAKDETVFADRWIAPPNLISLMAERIKVQYQTQFILHNVTGSPIISTIPMSDLMTILQYTNRIPFYWTSSWNLTAKVEASDAYVSLMIPDPMIPFSRVSLTGEELIVECYEKEPHPDWALEAAKLLGIEDNVRSIQIHEQRYAKILPIDETVRKHFIWWATDQFNIYSLGRYATWRPGLLLDDLVQDVRLIDRWLTQGNYDVALHR